MPRNVQVCVASLLCLIATCVSGTAGAQSANLGKQIFTETANPPCALCHALKDAGATGEIGPDLDELKPDLQKVLAAVRNGVGAMPPFSDALTPAQISAVARYVAGAVRAGR